MLKPLLRAILPAPIVERLQRRPPESFVSYSQEGEDMVLRRFFEDQPTGFYIDVGAHHPIKFSNTQFFYLQGWRGINIDAMPGSMKVFDQQRPRDINIEAAIADVPQTLTYFIFNQPALNSFDAELSLQRDGLKDMRIERRIEVKTQSLTTILESKLPATQAIDFLSIDVEGLDMSVLRSNDWTRYRPRAVLVEDMSITSLDQVERSATTAYLRERGYEPLASTMHTIFYQRLEKD